MVAKKGGGEAATDDAHPAWIPQRLVTSKKTVQDPNARDYVDVPTLKSTPDLYKKNSDLLRSYPNVPEPIAKKAIDMLKRGDIVGPRIYEVHIAAHPEHLLDWDKPLAQQGAHVQQQLLPFAQERAARMAKARKEAVERQASGNRTKGSFFKPLTPEKIEEYKKPVDPGTFTGKNIYNFLQQHHGAVNENEKMPESSAYLASRGIPGLKYLDAGSRGSFNDPSHNYVVFDDKLLNIKRKYAAGGSAHKPSTIAVHALGKAHVAPVNVDALIDRLRGRAH